MSNRIAALALALLVATLGWRLLGPGGPVGPASVAGDAAPERRSGPDDGSDESSARGAGGPGSRFPGDADAAVRTDPGERWAEILAAAELRESAERPVDDSLRERVSLYFHPGDGIWIRRHERFRRNESGVWESVGAMHFRGERFFIQAPLPRAAELEAMSGPGGEQPVRRGAFSHIHLVDIGEVTLAAYDRSRAYWEQALASRIPLAVVQRDRLRLPAATPNDPRRGEQYALDRIDAERAWQWTTGDPDVVVAVLDSGIALSHPDLRSNLWRNPGEIADNGLDDDGNGLVDDIHGWDFLANDARPNDIEGHGTAVAGVIGAHGNNSRGVAGVNWRVSMIALRCGNDTFSDSDLIDALDYVRDLRMRQGVPVVATNNSYGSFNLFGLSDPAFVDAISRQNEAGILFVGAAGNSSNNNDTFSVEPVNNDHPNVISVAATDAADRLVNFSNFGRYNVHLAAPGDDVLTTDLNGGYTEISGTSFSSPYVVGAIALVKAANPALDMGALRDTILGSVDYLPSLDGNVFTDGRLNVGRAVESAVRLPAVSMSRPAARALQLPSPGTALLLQPQLLFGSGFGDLGSGSWSWSVRSGSGGSLDDAGVAANEAFFVPSGPGPYVLEGEFVDGIFTERETLWVSGQAGVASLSEGLIAHWTFDEGEGQEAVDRAGGDHNGNIVGAAWADGILGGALRFNGSTDRVSFPFARNATATIAAWIRTDSRGNSVFPRVVNLPEFSLYLGRQDFFADPRSEVAYGNVNNLKLFTNRTGDIGVWHTPADEAIEDGVWIHVAASFDADARRPFPRLYINGRRQVVGTQDLAAPQGGFALDGDTGFIGNREALDRAFDGLIDDVRIYNRILDPAEVAALAALPDMVRVDPPAVSSPSPVRTGEPAPFLATAGEPPRTWLWEALEGPAPVQISSPAAPSTSVEFTAPGTYRLRLRADDGATTVASSVEVTAMADALSVDLAFEPEVALANPAQGAALVVRLGSIQTTPVQVDFEFGGDAAEGIDFEPVASSVSIAPGQTEARIAVIPRLRAGGDEAVRELTARWDDPEDDGLSEARLAFHPYRFAAWRERFAAAFQNVSLEESRAFDGDGDGLDALAEFSLGLDPEWPEAWPAALGEPFLLEHSGERYLAFSYRRPVGIAGVQVRGTVADRSDTGADDRDPAIAVGTVPDGNGYERITIRAADPVSGQASQFIRLEIEADGMSPD